MFAATTLYTLDKECRSIGGLIGRHRRDGKDTTALERSLAVARVRLALVNAVVANGLDLTEDEAEVIISTVRQGVAA